MSFPLLGNERIRLSIENAVSQGRFPHAVIIEGEAGTGKKTLAKYLAKTAVCMGDSAPCDICRSCRLADAGTHPDIDVVSPLPTKKNITFDQIEDFIKSVYQSAHTADRRVFIIEQAETLNDKCQNSLLKVIEEPPSDIVFIFLVPASERLLETIKSRCVVYSLFPPPTEEGVTVLQNEHSVDAETAEILLTKTDGNIGKALYLLNKEKGNLGADTAYDYFNLIMSGQIYEALTLLSVLDKNRAEATAFITALKDIIAKKTAKSIGLRETSKELVLMFDAVAEMEPLLHTNIVLPLFFTALTSKLSAIKDNC